jgi:hypothetical protein
MVARPIVVGVDGSEESMQAVESIVAGRDWRSAAAT